MSNAKVSDLTFEPVAAKRQKDAVMSRKKGISANLTLVNFLKGMIGPGCFSLPLAFREAGLWAGFVLVFITGALTCFCMLKIVRCSQFLTSQNPNSQSLNYAETADKAFKQSFGVIRNYGHIARRFVNIGVSSLVLGICAIYYIFVVDHTKEERVKFMKEYYTVQSAFMFRSPHKRQANDGEDNASIMLMEAMDIKQQVTNFSNNFMNHKCLSRNDPLTAPLVGIYGFDRTGLNITYFSNDLI
uniref:Aa_trans domain-containing protein n=1 Tax=Angiostrongylus cantonensis TaxID=6313 RepID=A0A0K0D0W2_ANGCA